MRIGRNQWCFASGVASTADRKNYAVMVLRDIKDDVTVLVLQKAFFSMGIQHIDSYTKWRHFCLVACLFVVGYQQEYTVGVWVGGGGVCRCQGGIQ